MEPRPLLIVEHEPDAHAGLLAGWATERGLALHIVRPGTGQPMPAALSGFRGVVLLGSEQTAFDDSVPWLAAELALTGRALADDIPLLGICFGGQVLARALGARVYRLPEPEIGWIQLAAEHPEVPAGPWLAWHRDGFELPAGTRQLAGGAVSVQAFATGPHLGLQFHPEATGSIMEAWLSSVGPRPGPELAAQLRRGWQQAAGVAAGNAAALFSAWLDGRFAADRQLTAGT